MVNERDLTRPHGTGSGKKQDVVVVGAGIVGLAVSLRLLKRYPALRVTLLEKESEIASHQTGHNSGVIHSGIYYRPGSLKATLCVRGAKMLFDFVEEHGIRHKKCGKLIIATRPEELTRLDTLFNNGLENGLNDLVLLNPDGIREIEPHARGLRAIFSPRTSVLDFKEVAQKIADIFIKLGGRIVLGERPLAIAIENNCLRITTAQEEITSSYLINTAGLYSDVVARLMNVEPRVRIIPFRGEYFKVRDERKDLVRSLIYPVPDPELPFLGIHFTRTIHDELKAGPNAVLALAREAYSPREIDLKEFSDTLLFPGFWRMGARYWKTGFAEMWRAASRKVFAKKLRAYVPEITERDLEPGPTGLRAQCVDDKGVLVNDFKIVEAPRSLHVLNVPSPAATASLAIAEYLTDRCTENFTSRERARRG